MRIIPTFCDYVEWIVKIEGTTSNFGFFFSQAQNVSIVAVGYGVEANINTTVLKEIGGDNVLIMNEDKTLGYAPFVDPIKKLVCSKSIFSQISCLPYNWFHF